MKKIMFNDTYSLTDAVLQKRKTNTRRTNQKLQCLSDLSDCGYTPQIRWNKVIAFKGNSFVEVCNLPYQVGEVVAIAQRYKDIYSDISISLDLRNKVYDLSQNTLHEAGWNNKMFVKAEFMPHQIKIADIKIERLRDISDEDCIKEGIIKSSYKQVDNTWSTYYWHLGVTKQNCPYGQYIEYNTARDAFPSLIDAVSGNGTWEYNPYVLVYEFELIK